MTEEEEPKTPPGNFVEKIKKDLRIEDWELTKEATLLYYYWGIRRRCRRFCVMPQKILWFSEALLVLLSFVRLKFQSFWLHTEEKGKERKE